MHDIRNREDIVRLVDAFYTRAMRDEVIGYIFTDVAHLDLDQHLPLICDFWETVLLGNATYRRNAMRRHLDLNEKEPLRPEHFARWLQLFEAIVDELFKGEKANLAKSKAHSIAGAMQRRLEAPDPLNYGIPLSRR